MATLYLHIGTPKTGTSAIQSILSDNRNLLEKQNIVFPDFGLRYAGASKGRNGHFLNAKDDPDGKGYDLAIREICELSSRYDKIILSEEGLWREPERLPQFMKDLKQNGIEVKFIVYFRRQDLYLQSQYAQHVKTFMKKTFEEYAETQKLHMDYYKRLQTFAELVRKKDLIIRVYEKQQFVNQDLIDDFFAQVGIQNRKQFVQEAYVNESIGGVYLETKRILNRNEEFCGRGNFVVSYLKKAAASVDDRASFSTNQFFSYER